MKVTLLLSVLLLQACMGLQTRRDLRLGSNNPEVERPPTVKGPVTKEQKQAAKELKEEELSDSVRELRGKIEALEYKFNRSAGSDLQRMEIGKQQLELLSQRVGSMEQRIAQLERQIKSPNRITKSKSNKKKGYFEKAEDYFKQKKWKLAIVEFNKYRETYPKGRRFSLATYRIAVCFQEMGDKEAAKAFYQEVIENFPKTKSARSSRYRLNQMKK